MFKIMAPKPIFRIFMARILAISEASDMPTPINWAVLDSNGNCIAKAVGLIPPRGGQRHSCEAMVGGAGYA